MRSCHPRCASNARAFGKPFSSACLVSAATLLYDKVKDKPMERITIRRKVVTEISEEGILQILEEELDQECR